MGLEECGNGGAEEAEGFPRRWEGAEVTESLSVVLKLSAIYVLA